mmetsp:Transcript_32733/g.71863  ORF Transcript_32733/g.71863 Transcript_32733/m.71863 type:complete len:275 (-) Transcript_32733:2805-3629(-)
MRLDARLAALEHGPHQLRVARSRRNVQARPALVVRGVGVGAACEKERHRLCLAAARVRQQLRRRTLGIQLRAALDEQPRDAQVAAGHRLGEWRRARRVLRAQLASQLGQRLDRDQVARRRSQVHAAAPVGVGRVQLEPGVDEHAHVLEVAVAHERRQLSRRVRRRHRERRAVPQQLVRSLESRGPNGEQDRLVAPPVCTVDVRLLVDEHLGDREVAQAGGAVQRGELVAVCGVDVAAAVDEERRVVEAATRDAAGQLVGRRRRRAVRQPAALGR